MSEELNKELENELSDRILRDQLWVESWLDIRDIMISARSGSSEDGFRRIGK